MIRSIFVAGIAAAAAAILSAAPRAPAFGDSPWLYGIHWFGPSSNAPDVNQMTGGKPVWVLETVMTNDGYGQWGPEGQLANFQNTVSLGHTLIIRVQPVWGKAFPLPGDPNPSMATFLDQVTHTATLYKDVCHIWHLGNEMNLLFEWGGQALMPEAYIDAAVQFSDRIKAVQSSLGPQIVLVGPVGIGNNVGGDKHMGNTEYLSRMCDHINAMNYRDKFDGFAMHAYGYTWSQDLDTILSYFETEPGWGYQDQIGVIDARGFTDYPIYITEWNRYTGAANGPEEYASATFLHNAFARVAAWNESHHPVVCACWFVYPSDPQWNNYSLLALKNDDTPDRDVWHAFQYACTLNLPAGCRVQTTPGFYKVGWNLTGVPVEPYNPEASAVFQDLVDIGNVVTDNLYRYDTGAGYVLYPWQFSDVTRGSGYWLWLNTVAGDTVVSVAGQVATSDVSVSLSQGWNLIGHPFTESVPLADCQVRKDQITRSFDGAVAQGWVAGSLYYWEPGSGYRVARSAGWGHDDSLRPWRGYWLKAFVADLELVVPRPQ